MTTATKQQWESKERRDSFEGRDEFKSEDAKLGVSGQRIIIVPHDQVVALQEFLDSDGEDQVGTEATFTARFTREIEADIKVCQGDPPFVDAVLHENGSEIDLLNVGETLCGEYVFDVDGRTFVVHVVDEQDLQNDPLLRSKFFDIALATYLQGVQQSIEEADLVRFTHIQVRSRSATYLAIDRCEYNLEQGIWKGGRGGSIHSFVASADKTTKGLGQVNMGDVLKPATWKAPAKHARGNIFDASNGLASNRWTGPAYLT